MGEVYDKKKVTYTNKKKEYNQAIIEYKTNHSMLIVFSTSKK